jgi:hypothetical protein
MKKRFYVMLLLCCMSSVFVNAQVTIGSGNSPHSGSVLDLSKTAKDLGLLLPRVALEDIHVFQLSGDKNQAIGMIVFNTSPDTKDAQGVIGEFVWNGTKWLPIAIDGGRMNILPADYLGSQDNPISNQGDETSTVTIENSGCDISGSYIFSIIAGNEYAYVTPVISINPEFTVSFSENPTGKVRKAVILVTDPCGKTGTFIFSQKDSTCVSNMEPAVQAYFGTNIYTTGAVYAHVTTLTPAGDLSDHSYYWLLNNALVATGEGVVLTMPGTYTVYVDQIGCGTPGTITLTNQSEIAPAPKRIIVNNEGIICGSSGKVKLSALNVIAGDNIYWFKDGVCQNPGAPAAFWEPVGEGYEGIWYSVNVDASGHASAPSNTVIISYQDGGAPIAVPQVLVNDRKMDGSQGALTLCANGTLKLEVINRTDPSYVNPVFVWYANDSILGHSDGEAIYVVPGGFENIILSAEAKVVGSCPSSATSSEILVNRSGTPDATIINQGNAEAYICGNNPAVLTASIQNGASYEWFTSTSVNPIAQANQYSHSISVPGYYTVRYTNAAGCWSQISQSIRVIQSNAVNLIWGVKPAAEEINTSSKTYSVVSAPDALSYRWSSNDDATATITPLGNGSSALVIYGDRKSVV